MARQPHPCGQRLAARELLLGCRERIYIGCTGCNTVLWKITFHHEDLAAPAQSPSSANGINIDAEYTSRLKERRPDRKSAALT
jgi:hypothetical protein